jgi:hypothetical protein
MKTWTIAALLLAAIVAGEQWSSSGCQHTQRNQSRHAAAATLCSIGQQWLPHSMFTDSSGIPQSVAVSLPQALQPAGHVPPVCMPIITIG